MFRSPERPTFARSGGCVFFFCLRRPHFFQQRKKWGKERRQKLRFCISSRAMPWEKVRVPAARSRKSSCVVPSKDCLSNSAAAADWSAVQRLRFYRCNSERKRRKRERSERRRWRIKRGERVAAVKISSARRKAAKKFWAPQQDHPALRKGRECGAGFNLWIALLLFSAQRR